MDTKNKRPGMLVRIREGWRRLALEPGMPYAEYPFKKLPPQR